MSETPSPAGPVDATGERALPRCASCGGLLRPDVVWFGESLDPDATLLAFLQSTYEAAANAGGWDRPALERRPVA